MMSIEKKSHAAIAAAIGLLAVVGSGTAWAIQSGPKVGQSGTRVEMDGATLFADVREMNGRPYVALSDVAKSMGMKVVRSGNRYTLAKTAPGDGVSAAYTGRNKRGEFTGKMNTDVSSSSWSLRVLSAQQVASYSDRFGPGTEPVALKQAGDILIAVRCRLKNRSSATQEVYFDRGSAGNTSLTDGNQHAYSPSAFDSRNSDYSTNKMLAGMAQEFTIVFSVPRDTQMKDLVYTVATSGADNTTDFRVALAP